MSEDLYTSPEVTVRIILQQCYNSLRDIEFHDFFVEEDAGWVFKDGNSPAFYDDDQESFDRVGHCAAKLLNQAESYGAKQARALAKEVVNFCKETEMAHTLDEMEHYLSANRSYVIICSKLS